MGLPPLPFCVCVFFYVFKYVVMEDYNSPLCVQSPPSPFLVIYECKNLMFNIVWCKTTIVDDVPPSSLLASKMSLRLKTTERLGARDTLPGSQHFKGVQGRVGASGWD